MSSSALPSNMRAIQIAQTGGPEVLEYKELPIPELKEGQILVRNAYAGVNYIDTYVRSGLYKLPLPHTMGREGAGTVVKTSSPLFEEGARVVYMYTDAGSYGEYSAVQADKAVALPAGLAEDLAAAAFLQGLTAWTFVCEAGEVKAGQWVLVHAAAGGVGTVLVQMLRLVGARVIGTAGSEEKLELARGNGAEFVISSRLDDEALKAKIKEITGGHGVDVIFDGVGAATFDLDLEVIALKGTLVSFGNAVCTPGCIRMTLKGFVLTPG